MIAVKLMLDNDLKSIFESRAMLRQHSFNDEIRWTLENGLTDQERLQWQAELFVNRYLASREKRRQRLAEQEKIK